MPVPSSINDLSTTAGSNSPPGSESPATLDDYIRALSSFIALIRDTGYTRSNSVGTVSQSGGVPTGALMQYGSNANGEFWRFTNGLQICLSQSQSISITTASGAIFIAGSAPNWTFPIAFAAGTTPFVSSLPIGNSFIWGGGTSGATNTTAALRAYSSASISASVVGLAVGRWF